jgi:uncharacterized membrane protein
MFDTAHFHPMMVHFPIALIAIGFLADLSSLIYKKEACLSKMGYFLEVLGMLSAIAAFGTGYFLTSPMDGEPGIMRDKHQLFATITLVSIIVATLYRTLLMYQKKEETNAKYVAMGFFFVAFVFVLYTGFLGGSLVINYMIGL